MGAIGNIRKELSRDNLKDFELIILSKKVKSKIKKLSGVILFDKNFGKSNYFDDKHFNLEELKKLDIKINEEIKRRGLNG